MQKLSYISSLLAVFVLISCSKEVKQEQQVAPKEGPWRMEMDLGKENILPFNFDLKKEQEQWKMTIKNAQEEILVDEIKTKGDTFFIQLPVFESEFVLTITDSKTMKGSWNNYYKGPDYKIPVTATYGEVKRFNIEEKNTSNSLGKRYKTIFSPNTEGEGKAIGMFQQQQNRISGTFATEKGDYRHLQGNISGNKLYLSTFDGSHAFLFTGTIKDSTIEGKFFSGTHWEEDWTATINDTFQLRNADSLTFIKEGYQGLSFEFPNSSAELISLTDQRYENKVVIVQIMGTWCPNCLDETNYLSGLYDLYKKEGLEIIALAFERTKTEERAFNNIRRLKEKTGANYEILLGGATSKEKASEKLPMLNHVMSYPTAIFLDKQKNVRRIHTGFYGPSTGTYYEEFTTKTENLVKELLAE